MREHLFLCGFRLWVFWRNVCTGGVWWSTPGCLTGAAWAREVCGGPLRWMVLRDWLTLSSGSGRDGLRAFLVAGQIQFFISSVMGFEVLFTVNTNLAGPTAGLALPARFGFLFGTCSEPTWLRLACFEFSPPPMRRRLLGLEPTTEFARPPGVWSCGVWEPSPFAPSKRELRLHLHGDTVDSGGGASFSLRLRVGAPPKLGGSSMPRKSSRLAKRSRVHALEQAMSCKAALRDRPPLAVAGIGGCVEMARSAAPMDGPASTTAGLGCCGELERGADGLRLVSVPSVHRRIKEKSANYGVLLSDVEVCCFMDYLGTAAADV